MQAEEPEERRSYSRRDILIIVLIILAVATVIGNFTMTTTAVSSVSSGPLTISENATCSGFGEPVYSSSMDSDVNFTSYQYGRCLFGFWVSNGSPVGSDSSGAPAL